MRIEKADRRVFGTLGFLAVGVAAVAQIPPQSVDENRGVIDGYVAVAAWPASETDPRTSMGADGFVAHIISMADPSVELTKPAGTWFVLDEGRFRVWVEGNGQISSAAILGFALRKAQEGEHGLRRLFPVSKAGTVALSDGVTLPPKRSLRLLEVTAGFTRRATPEAASRGVLMPQGNVVAAIFDEDKREYLAISRPAPLAPGGKLRVAPLAPPAPLTDLVLHAVLEGRPFRGAGAVEVVAVLDNGVSRPPDLIALDMNHLYAIWYGLDSKSVSVRLLSKSLGAEPASAALPPGGVRSLEMVCRKLPDVAVTLDLPPGFPREGLKLRALRKGELLIERAVAPEENRVVLQTLPAAPIELRLSAPPWSPRQEVDLSDGKDQAIDFRVDAITIKGRLSLCDSSEPAKLRFQTEGDIWADFTTDAAGKFQALVFQPVMLYQVLPAGRDDALVEILPAAIEHDQTLDIVLPCNDYHLQALDAQERKPIPGARVSVLNQRGDNNGGSSRLLHCDEKGTLRLPLLRPGELRLNVSAEGYEPVTIEDAVPEKKTVRTIEALLWPEKSVTPVRVLLPSGQPAAGAGVALLSLASSALLWEGTCDGSGVAKVPERPGATHLGARHPAGGFALTPWLGGSSDRELVVRVPAGKSCLVAVTDGNGPSRRAGIALWVDGLRLTGVPLMWLSGVPSGTDSSGYWRPSGLPAAEIGILAFQRGRGLEQRLQAGELDSMRTPLVPAQGQVVTLRALE